MKLKFAMFAAALFAGVSAHAAGTNLMIRSVIGGDAYCMDVAEDAKENGTPVFMYRCHGRENQRWTITRGEGGQDLLVGTGGLCMDVRSRHSRADGTPVQVWACHYGSNQRFKVGGDGRIREVESGKCLIPVAQRNAAAIVLDECEGQPYEVWDIRH